MRPKYKNSQSLNARARALKLLARREHSVYELTEKLKLYYELEEIELVIEELLEKDWLSDERFCEALIRHKVAAGQGPLKIENELSLKGIARVDARAMIDASDVDWVALCHQVWRNRFNQVADNFKAKAKQMRFLQSRGFETEQINQALNEERFNHNENE